MHTTTRCNVIRARDKDRRDGRHLRGPRIARGQAAADQPGPASLILDTDCEMGLAGNSGAQVGLVATGDRRLATLRSRLERELAIGRIG